MAGSNGKISVVISSFNNEETIERAITSATHQTYTAMEVICIDDGSTDNTLSLMKAKAAVDPRIKVVALPQNKGTHNARRAGLAQATGDLVMFLDGDDELTPTIAAAVAEAYAKRPFDILHFAMAVDGDGVVNEGRTRELEEWTRPLRSPLSGGAILRQAFVDQSYAFNVAAKAFPRALATDAFEDLGELSLVEGEDALEYFAIASRAQNYRPLHQPIGYRYHLGHGSSEREVMDLEQFDRLLQGRRSVDAMEDFLERRGNKERYEEILGAYRNNQLRYLMRNWRQNLAPQYRPEGLRRMLEVWAIEDLAPLFTEAGIAFDGLLMDAIGQERFNELGVRPKVTVLMPIYNAEPFLEQSLGSVCNQTYRNLEIILINDGSQDGSAAIIERFAASDPRIRVITKPNSGYGDSMNRGLEVATGDYIGLVEPDDFAEPIMYEAYMLAAQSCDADLVKSNYFAHSDEGDRIEAIFDPVGISYHRPLDPRRYPELIATRQAIWSALYRRSLIEDNGIRFAPTPGAAFQDTSFVQMCWACARRVVILSEAFLHYRTDNEASSSNSTDKAFLVCGEYERGLDFLRSQGSETLALFGPFANALRMGAYRWNYQRIAPEGRREFAQRWSEELQELEAEGLMDYSLFTEDIQNKLALLSADPDAFVERYPEGFPWPDPLFPNGPIPQEPGIKGALTATMKRIRRRLRHG